MQKIKSFIYRLFAAIGIHQEPENSIEGFFAAVESIKAKKVKPTMSPPDGPLPDGFVRVFCYFGPFEQFDDGIEVFEIDGLTIYKSFCGGVICEGTLLSNGVTIQEPTFFENPDDLWEKLNIAK